MPSSQRELLEAQVSRFSRTPDGSTAAALRPERVLVVPYGARLEAGFRVARRLLNDGTPLRLVGTCATEPSAWPDWVAAERQLVLTELGAYRFHHTIAGSAPLMKALHRWLDDVFGSSLTAVAPSRALSHAAAMRFYQILLDGHLCFEGIRLLHDRQRIFVSSSRGGAEDELAPPGAAMRALRKAAWPVAITAAMAAAFVASVPILVREHTSARLSHERLRSLATNATARAKPTLWISLVPDLLRANQHVLESVVEPALERGEKLGVILVGSLRSGARTEAQLRSDTRAPLWPGLGPLSAILERIDIDQCVGPDSAKELRREVLAFAATCPRVVRKIVTRSTIESDGVAYSLLPFVWDVARLATLDLARARRALNATTRFLARHDMRGARIVTASSGGCEISPVDAKLQEAGATTIELFHGTAGVQWHGFAESNSSVRSVWSEVDRELHQGARHAAVVGGMPIRVKRTRTPHVPPKNVLVMTNLVHRNHGIIGFPWQHFQKGLVRALDEISRDPALDLRIRWRPHPGDDERLVREDHRTAPRVELSTGQPLQEDIDWADIAVSNPSTVLVEALLTDIPVIGYLIPDLMVGCEFIHPSRVAFNGPELRKALVECVTRLAAGDPDALAPERHALTNLFGPKRLPRPLDLREAHAAGSSRHGPHPTRSNGVSAAVSHGK